jgi:hypothetical protein
MERTYILDRKPRGQCSNKRRQEPTVVASKKEVINIYQEISKYSIMIVNEQRCISFRVDKTL